jgi:hypothetical protein
MRFRANPSNDTAVQRVVGPPYSPPGPWFLFFACFQITACSDEREE